MNINRKEKGFTIIEVVLVLAIAGLIFMMVFVALPSLQRNTRDTQRKDDLSRAMTAVTSFTNNNNGSLPANNDAAWKSFEDKYLTASGDTFIDPSGTGIDSTATAYVFDGSTSDLGGVFDENTQNIIYYSEGYTCGTDSSTIVKAGSRKIALRMYLEGGGVTCQDN